MDSTVALEGLAAQRRLIEKLEKEHFGWDIIVGDAFVRGIRDIRYKSTSYAVAEIVDNAIQASARRIDIIFGYDDGTKPSKLSSGLMHVWDSPGPRRQGGAVRAA